MKLSLFQGIGYVILHKPCLHQSLPDKLATLSLYHRTFVCQSSSYLNLCVFGTSWFESLLVAQQGIEHTRTHTHVGKVSPKNKPLFARGQASVPHSKHKGDNAGGVERAIRNSKRTTPDQPGVSEHRLSFADLHYTPHCNSCQHVEKGVEMWKTMLTYITTLLYQIGVTKNQPKTPQVGGTR